MKIFNIVGARPNFMKMAPLVRCLRERGVEQKLVHTGQHYDDNMSKVFFDDLQMPAPDLYLGWALCQDGSMNSRQVNFGPPLEGKKKRKFRVRAVHGELKK